MRSATSFFDKALFRSQLKHTWPLWLGYTALWLFLVPVALFSELSAYQGSYSAADASSLLLNAGFTLKDVQEWMGHADIKMTANIYGHLDMQRKQLLTQKMASSLF